ncbi:hypothetical protein PCCS19_34590 [Paenibacillus sp. CCS19]|uniref:hypothetical protein n=1 Tax=Paenibacillus sp. CCS19 TaxID=3158387 RepID=UPI00256B5D5B|nr:hypothetical protein [Paenibacillus cellulosilyticus]GMK40403.1 hypothetical protein PCCS19_34590 [Paenibacillus cellulosilyticus]
MKIMIPLLIALLLLTGCNQSKAIHSEDSMTEATHNPTAQEIIAQDPDADIFQYKGVIYGNASKVEWVQQEKVTAGEKVGTITQQYKEGLNFEDGMATKLPVGVEFYEPTKKSGPILLVKLNGEEVRYLGLIEG